MKIIPKATQAQIDAAVDALDDEARKVRETIEAYNGVLAHHRGALADVITEYNTVAGVLRELLEGLQTTAQEYFEGRSVKWQDSDAGSQYAAWVDQLDLAAHEIEDIEFAEPEDFEEPAELFDSEQWQKPDPSPDQL